MHRFLLLITILLLGGTLQAADKKHFVLYAMFTAQTRVQLTDGPPWLMDKGDTFPVRMFKNQQTKVVLQLAGTDFTTDSVNVKIIEEKDVTPQQLATYRTNVQHYLDNRAAEWKTEQAKSEKPK